MRELLEPLGEVAFKRMFGGAGVYRHEVMFALAMADELYIKVDAETRARFEAAGFEPFTYTRKDGVTDSMSYWRVPPAEAEDPDVVSAWGRLGLEAAMRAKSNKARKGKPAKKTELLFTGPWDED